MRYFIICLPSFIDFGHSVTKILGGGRNAPSPRRCEMGPKSPALLGVKNNISAYLLVIVVNAIMDTKTATEVRHL